jgi:hypothetical protein
MLGTDNRRALESEKVNQMLTEGQGLAVSLTQDNEANTLFRHQDEH